jgi:hypothetical protein
MDRIGMGLLPIPASSINQTDSEVKQPWRTLKSHDRLVLHREATVVERFMRREK